MTTHLMFLEREGRSRPYAWGESLDDILASRSVPAAIEASIRATGAAVLPHGAVLYVEPWRARTLLPAMTLGDADAPTVLCFGEEYSSSHSMKLYPGESLDEALEAALPDYELMGGGKSRAGKRAEARAALLSGVPYGFGWGSVFPLPAPDSETRDAYRAYAARLLSAGVTDMKVWQDGFDAGLPVEFAVATSLGGER